MGRRIKLNVAGSQELALVINSAQVHLDDYYGQCWCVKLSVCWQTLTIDGWAFLSGKWGELVFHKTFDGQPPHFISGVAIETDGSNDLLWEFSTDIGIDPEIITAAIFSNLSNIMFSISPVNLHGELLKARAFRIANPHLSLIDAVHKI